MPRWLPLVCAGLLWAAPVHAQGLLVPSDKDMAPLNLVTHQVEVQIDEQVATTRVTQVFRNHTNRALEATYVFPVPKGASVNKFSMWVNGKEEKGELVEADKARQIYTEIVRRAQDPGLLEYVGNNLLKVRVFPVPANGDQKLSLSFTSVVPFESGLNEYVYPLKTNEQSARALEKFTLDATIKSKQVIANVYSPTHPITVQQHNDHEYHVAFERSQATLDRDFVLYYSHGGKDVGLTAAAYRPSADADGYVMLLIAPRAELDHSREMPRDFVFVLDTSGSMAGAKMEQARKALKFCLSSLTTKDRFALMNFATTVNKYADNLIDARPQEVAKAKAWVDELQATGGTAINDALNAALDYRGGSKNSKDESFRSSGPMPSEGAERVHQSVSKDEGRSFTVVFFTDGQPTVGETDPEKIIKNVMARNTDATRIFTFGVGDDVNAAMLDRLAEQTRAVSTYVRPEEDIEVKVSGLYAKISHPVLTEVELTVSHNVELVERYPQKLSDLFHGGQAVVLARYKGKGHALVTLKGKVACKDGGCETKSFDYEIDFPARTSNDKAFVEGLWARRKVGFLLDQIRNNGEQKELVDEVVKLAKKHGITTPYTSYLMVPDSVAAPPVVSVTPVGTPTLSTTTISNQTYGNRGTINYAPTMAPPAAPGAAPPVNTMRVFERGGRAPMSAAPAPSYLAHGGASQPAVRPTPSPGFTYEAATDAAAPAGVPAAPIAQTGKEGVDLALQMKALTEQEQVTGATTRQAAGRTCVQVNGVWTDQALDGKAAVVKVKALSDAYFRMLEKHPELKELFQLGNRLVWMTPSGTVLVVEPQDGKDKMGDDEIEKLFVARK
jgi:Ca-activated chloride channel family protein